MEVVAEGELVVECVCRNVETLGNAAFGVAIAVDLHRSRFRRGREDGGRKQWKDEKVEQRATRHGHWLRGMWHISNSHIP